MIIIVIIIKNDFYCDNSDKHNNSDNSINDVININKTNIMPSACRIRRFEQTKNSNSNNDIIVLDSNKKNKKHGNDGNSNKGDELMIVIAITVINSSSSSSNNNSILLGVFECGIYHKTSYQ